MGVKEYLNINFIECILRFRCLNWLATLTMKIFFLEKCSPSGELLFSILEAVENYFLLNLDPILIFVYLRKEPIIIFKASNFYLVKNSFILLHVEVYETFKMRV